MAFIDENHSVDKEDRLIRASKNGFGGSAADFGSRAGLHERHSLAPRASQGDVSVRYDPGLEAANRVGR
jgi:hypothetical protein